MSSCCVPLCATPQSVVIPGIEGVPGTDGTNGADGINAYTFATADAAAVLQGANVTVSVLNSAWMTVGQSLFAEDAGHFSVVSKPTPTSVILKFLAIGQNAATATILTGKQISPDGSAATALPSVSNYNVGGAGAVGLAYATILGAAVTLATAGTYLIFSSCRIDLAGATFAASKDVSVKLARTNNTPADVANAIGVVPTGIITTQTHLLASFPLPPVQYTATAGDIIEMQAILSGAADAGAVNAVETSILAIQLF